MVPCSLCPPRSRKYAVLDDLIDHVLQSHQIVFADYLDQARISLNDLERLFVDPSAPPPPSAPFSSPVFPPDVPATTPQDSLTDVCAESWEESEGDGEDGEEGDGGEGEGGGGKKGKRKGGRGRKKAGGLPKIGKIPRVSRKRREQDRKEALLQHYASQGLDPKDPRLQAVVFYQTAAGMIEEKVRKILDKGDLNDADAANVLKLLGNAKPLLKEARDTLSAMMKENQAGKKETRVEEIFRATMEEAEEYIRKHSGEFFFRCARCNEWVTTDGVPVWMITYMPDSTNPKIRVPYLGSPETFFLLNTGQISLEAAAFMLRTSPEGLLYTAAKCGRPLQTAHDDDPDSRRSEILLAAEENLRRIRRTFDFEERKRKADEERQREELDRPWTRGSTDEDKPDGRSPLRRTPLRLAAGDGPAKEDTDRDTDEGVKEGTRDQDDRGENGTGE